MARILGIESSCDETAAAVVTDGEHILSNVISSQVALHARYGGVVPELASRAHVERIVPVVREACERAGVGYRDLDAIAVTCGPGLIGSLLVGLTYAKSLAWSLSKPLLGVNHLEGHIHAVLLEERQKGAAARTVEFPVVTLVVSGGHTSLYEVNRAALENGSGGYRYRYRRLGHTLDDAAGEAYDKVAKLLALGYPGGPVIDRLARGGSPTAFSFTRPTLRRAGAYDFSFSGLKTAVVRLVEKNGFGAEIAERRAQHATHPKAPLEELVNQRTRDLLASFQETVVEELVERTLAAAEDCGAHAVFVSGGVAANSRLRACFGEETAGRGLPLFFPSVALSTDNAAMIAAAAFPRFQAGEFATLDLNADPSLPLGD